MIVINDLQNVTPGDRVQLSILWYPSGLLLTTFNPRLILAFGKESWFEVSIFSKSMRPVKRRLAKRYSCKDSW